MEMNLVRVLITMVTKMMRSQNKKAIESKIKALKNDFKTKEKELKNDFKTKEKELKKQLKELRKTRNLLKMTMITTN